MTKRETEIRSDRRDFLKLAGLGTAAAGGAVVASATGAEAAEPEAGKSSAGYRESEHVKAFYASARF